MPAGANPGLTRRRFCRVGAGAIAALAFATTSAAQVRAGALSARPKPAARRPPPGTQALGLGARDALLHVPARAEGPLPLLVLLHGAGSSGAEIFRRLGSHADEAGVAVLAPDSRSSTWDAVRGEFGPDVRFIDDALVRVFDAVTVDGARVSIGGFSDGATYALSLGLVNGDLFRRILAFSPGFVVGRAVVGKPRVFVTHGTGDPILPIDRCSRVIVPTLQKRGYDVTFREFAGGHEVPAALAREAMAWAAGGSLGPR